MNNSDESVFRAILTIISMPGFIFILIFSITALYYLIYRLINKKRSEGRFLGEVTEETKNYFYARVKRIISNFKILAYVML